ncbi:Wings apart-like protein [Venturia nashicola]|uniref:Wings apart-like protein n=1 Tax=Venturia nashicola TaxID=86259 RepID=A0A4Z1P536_9PEZI|nr:Wings apart-like protein [Venturia nashicola]
MSMLDIPVKPRKIITYGRRTSKPGAYTIGRDEVSPDRSRYTTSTAWPRTPSLPEEQPKSTTTTGELPRLSPKRKQDTAWDGPSEEDEVARPFTLTLKPPATAFTSKSRPLKPSRAKSVPQHAYSTEEAQITPDSEKKRKREILTRASSEAPRDTCKGVDVSEMQIEENRMERRARSREPSRPVKTRAPQTAKKKPAVGDDFDFPSDEERLLTSKKPKAVSGRKKEAEICDTAMEEHEMTIQSRSNRIRETPQHPEQRVRTSSLTANESYNSSSRKEAAHTIVAKVSRLAPKKVKGKDIFEFPSDEESLVLNKSKASKPRDISQPPRKRVRTPAVDRVELVPTRSRETKSPEPARSHNNAQRFKATVAEPPTQPSMQQPKISKAAPTRPKTLPGVGWHPSLAIHSPPRRFQQGSSAPAALFNMVREPAQSPPTDSSENVIRAVAPEMEFDDEMQSDTPMADFGSPSTVRATASSQTPKQNSLWGQLLNPEPGDSPSDLPISELNLKSTRKPPSIARSSSDIPQTAFSRSNRLIDSLKASAPVMEDVDEDEDVDTAMESSPDPAAMHTRPARDGTSIRTASAKVTYAQQRTFLKENNEEEMYDMLADELSQQTGGYGAQSQNNIIDESDPEDSQEAAPRGVHDLRAAGAKRRLLDELDHLVEDVQGTAVKTVSARRSALMEVTEKLIDPGAATILLDSGMDLRLIQSMDDMTDVTFTFLAATTIALLANAGATLVTLDRIRGSKVFGRIVSLLSQNKDISKVVKERRSNMSKVAQSSMIDFRETVFKSCLFNGVIPTILSPQLMAIRCLDSLVRKVREQDSRVALFDEKVIEKLLSIARSNVAEDSADVALLEPIISLLEAHTPSRSAGWSLEAVDVFAHVLPAIFGSTNPALQHTKFLALRLSLNLTNENHATSDIFAIPSLTRNLVHFIHQQCALLREKVASEVHAVNIDNTILALGVMINLTEFSDQVRLSVLDGGHELLTKAVEIFLESTELADKADSVEEGQTNVAFGYHAFMLGNLCQNEKVRGIVRRQLPGSKLTFLLEEMQQFTNLHQRMDKARLQGAEGEELERGHAQRLQALVDTLVVLDG